MLRNVFERGSFGMCKPDCKTIVQQINIEKTSRYVGMREMCNEGHNNATNS